MFGVSFLCYLRGDTGTRGYVICSPSTDAAPSRGYHIITVPLAPPKVYFFLLLTSHGNNCAGVIAAVANNSYCGVGIAYSANISGKQINLCIHNIRNS